MRGHRCSTCTRVETESDTDSDSGTMRCISCKEYYGRCDAGTCKECYEEASETEEELKREIDDLKAKVAFLRFWSPLDHHITHRSSAGPCFTDVVLVASSDDGLPGTASSVPVPAHKAVLASRSPVFKAMLENEMEESRVMAYDLLILAEKYEVKHLKAYCEKFLVSKLNWDNSFVSYAFAHQHNAKHLLESALSLITDNMDKLTKREEYMELVEKDPRLVVDIYEAYLSKQVNTAALKESSSKKP
ncbi:hypothetical protein DKX38_008143 [Salix brachista]|uniref:BTB domain-containing protein n=1 Tax=Salix brachista TaxID=2182728 RepID=A0A5N5MQ54_9ROSI|nr:hypothetical protein DKX38_008143 [Salix brachista]